MYKKQKRHRSMKAEHHLCEVFGMHQNHMKQLTTFYLINLGHRLFCYAIEIHSIELII